VGGVLGTAHALTALSSVGQTQDEGGRRSVRRPHRVQNSVVARDYASGKPPARPNVLLGATNAIFPFMQLPNRTVGNHIDAGIQVPVFAVAHEVLVMLNITYYLYVVPIGHTLDDHSDFLKPIEEVRQTRHLQVDVVPNGLRQFHMFRADGDMHGVSTFRCE